MIWGAPLGACLEMDADELVDWQRGQAIIERPKRQFLALFELWVTDRLETIPANLNVTRGDSPISLLQYACVEWLRTGQLALESAGDVIARTEITKDSSDEEREALLALAAVAGNPEQLSEVRSLMLYSRPKYLDIVSESFVETLFLTQDDIADTWGEDRHVLLGWVFQLCSKVNGREHAATLFALGIRYCEAKGLDVRTVIRDAFHDIDENIYLSPSTARLATDDIILTVVRQPNPGVEVLLRVEGSGGRIDGGLPMVLNSPVYGLPEFLMRIMAGDVALKYLHKARSKKDIPELLSREGSMVTVKIQLDGDLSILNEDLNAYRRRVQTGLDWVKGCFPDVKADSDIVVIENP